jgi:5-methyltetrahydrofolate--homocysteine methyltransferase
MLTRHSEADHVVEVNKAGVEIARQAFGDKEGYVLGDIGPFGGLLQPFGEFTEEQVRSAFEEQAAALVEAGADAIIIETQTSLEELLIGIEAAQSGRREMHHRVHGLRRHSRWLDLPHHDGH